MKFNVFQDYSNDEVLTNDAKNNAIKVLSTLNMDRNIIMILLRNERRLRNKYKVLAHSKASSKDINKELNSVKTSLIRVFNTESNFNKSLTYSGLHYVWLLKLSLALLNTKLGSKAKVNQWSILLNENSDLSTDLRTAIKAHTDKALLLIQGSIANYPMMSGTSFFSSDIANEIKKLLAAVKSDYDIKPLNNFSTNVQADN